MTRGNLSRRRVPQTCCPLLKTAARSPLSFELPKLVTITEADLECKISQKLLQPSTLASNSGSSLTCRHRSRLLVSNIRPPPSTRTESLIHGVQTTSDHVERACRQLYEMILPKFLLLTDRAKKHNSSLTIYPTTEWSRSSRFQPNSIPVKLVKQSVEFHTLCIHA